MAVVAIAWAYVVLMMTVAEATSERGTLLGAAITFLLYGVLPLSIVLYLMGTPGRRRARQAASEAGSGDVDVDVDVPGSVAVPMTDAAAAAVDPDGGSHPAGDAVPSIRKEP